MQIYEKLARFLPIEWKWRDFWWVAGRAGSLSFIGCAANHKKMSSLCAARRIKVPAGAVRLTSSCWPVTFETQSSCQPSWRIIWHIVILDAAISDNEIIYFKPERTLGAASGKERAASSGSSSADHFYATRIGWNRRRFFALTHFIHSREFVTDAVALHLQLLHIVPSSKAVLHCLTKT